VADPSGRTFLFSLTNAHGRAVKLRLKNSERSRALNIARGPFGPGFGGGADLRLMCGKAAARSRGCYSDPTQPAFEIDNDSDVGLGGDGDGAAGVSAGSGLPQPVDFAYDESLLAGDDGKGAAFCFFAAAEIECWQL
jgi:hypothetical protein